MRKIINSETRKYEENVTDTLILDATPTVNSFNTVTSDGIARAIAGASGEVPVVTESDNGKVLTAVYDAGGPAVEWGTGPTVDQTYDAESTNAQSGVAVASAIGSVNAVPASDVEDAGKVLTVDASGDAGWETLSIPTVDQTYDGTSANAQSGTAVAEAIGTVNAVPASTSVDEGKVLTVDNAGSAAWATPAVPTVDQTYDATSANAQSGVAVAEAVGGVLPSLTGNAGKVLAVNSGETGTEWVTPAAPSGGSDEWWGGDPGTVTLSNKTVRLRFKDLTYDPRNDPDSTFTAQFSDIAKVADGIYDFTISSTNYANTFKDKYLADNEFIIVGFNGDNGYSWRTAQSIFQGCTGLRAVYNYKVAATTGTNNSSHAFNGCINLIEFHANDMTGTTNCTFSSMFYNCSSLKLCDASLVIRNTGRTAKCDQMFKGCTNLVTGPYFKYGLNNTSYMFERCSSLTGFVYKYESNEDSYYYQIVTSVNGDSMFTECYALDTASLPFFNFHVFYNISNMFSGDAKLRTPPSVLRISGASASSAFYNCSSLEKLPNMDYSEISLGASYMFSSCVMLQDISALATVTWNASLTNVSFMFLYCPSIQKGLKDVYDNMAATATITSHASTFTGCGVAYSNPDLALIPSSWGGTGA